MKYSKNKISRRNASITLMSIALLTGTVVLAGCGKSDHSASVGSDGEVMDSIPEMVSRIADAVSGGDAEMVASLTQYPLERPYPLRNILDSAEMVEYFPIMIDDSLRNAVAAASIPEAWTHAGWRGFTIGEGEYLWIDDGMYAVNYLSEPEKALRNILARQEIESLAPDLQRGWVPAFCLLDLQDGTLYRVDMLTDTITAEVTEEGVRHGDRQQPKHRKGRGKKKVEYEMMYPEGEIPDSTRTFRLMAYPRTYDLSGNPSVKMQGHMESDGTAQVRTYYFNDPTGAEAEYTFDTMADEDPVIIFRRPGGKPENHRVKSAYWRDYLSYPR